MLDMFSFENDNIYKYIPTDTFYTYMSSNQYKPLPYPQTPQSAREYFYLHGIAICPWARAQNIPVQSVKDLLYGKSMGRRGKSHDAAIALGLKLHPKKIKKGSPHVS